MNPVDREGLRRKLAFLFAGGFGFVVYYVGSLVLVRQLHVGPGVAAWLAVLVSITPTFLLQRSVAFRDRGPRWPAFVRYCALQAVNAIATGLLAHLGRRAGLADAVNFFVAGAVVVVASYLALNHLVFRHRAGR